MTHNTTHSLGAHITETLYAHNKPIQMTTYAVDTALTIQQQRPTAR
jgi:hypothetical protein